jgi:CRP/FNR family transcriptional regulator, cyclic AMP receptor protein
VDWPLLDGIPEEPRRRVLAAGRLRRFARGEVIFHEADPGDSLHLLAKGRVAIRVTTPVGEVATLAVLGPGDFFGELALLGPGSRTATVVALEKVETVSIHRDVFETLKSEHPSVETFLTGVLGTQVRRLSGQVLEALFVPADKRVLRRLWELAKQYGDGVEGTLIPLTQEDLASVAGTSRATVNRVLGQATDAGFVEVSRGKITVVDPAMLEKRAR